MIGVTRNYRNHRTYIILHKGVGLTGSTSNCLAITVPLVGDRCGLHSSPYRHVTIPCLRVYSHVAGPNRTTELIVHLGVIIDVARKHSIIINNGKSHPIVTCRYLISRYPLAITFSSLGHHAFNKFACTEVDVHPLGGMVICFCGPCLGGIQHGAGMARSNWVITPNR